MRERSILATGVALLLLLLLGSPLVAVPRPVQGDSVWSRVPPELKDLPLELVPASGAGSAFALLISGDGGWAPLPREVSAVLAGGGVSVIGLNALRYFWPRRTPEGTAADLERVLRYYLRVGGRQDVLLVGYSRGADVLPFIATRLPPDLMRHVRLLALLGPSEGVQFQFHLADWWSDRTRETDLPVLPEAHRLVGVVPLLCAYGEEEKDSICPRLADPRVELASLKGKHHFDGAYAELGELVLRAASRPRAPAPTSLPDSAPAHATPSRASLPLEGRR